jgi:hypothetical protein
MSACPTGRVEFIARLITDYGVVIAAGKGEPGAEVKREIALMYPDSKTTDPYLGPVGRGFKSFQEHRYEDALPDLKTASESKQAVVDDYALLGQYYGRLGRWDEAIIAHKRAFELGAKDTTGTDAALALLEAFIVGERPADVEPFVAGLVAKKWQSREEKTNRLNQASAMFYGFQAVAQRMLGKDATDLMLVLPTQPRHPLHQRVRVPDLDLFYADPCFDVFADQTRRHRIRVRVILGHVNAVRSGGIRFGPFERPRDLAPTISDDNHLAVRDPDFLARVGRLRILLRLLVKLVSQFTIGFQNRRHHYLLDERILFPL